MVYNYTMNTGQVCVVFRYHYHDPSCVIGVYTSLALALARIKDLESRNPKASHWYGYRFMQLDDDNESDDEF